ncbi:MAG: hypothetical protein AAGJ46_19410 [Planctomycetota bacterium]
MRLRAESTAQQKNRLVDRPGVTRVRPGGPKAAEQQIAAELDLCQRTVGCARAALRQKLGTNKPIALAVLWLHMTQEDAHVAA